MKAIADFLSGDWAQVLGWTLLHSLWQSLVILLVVVALLRLIDPRRSQLRYAVASAGLFLLIVSSVVTFTQLTSTEEASDAAPQRIISQVSLSHAPATPPPASSLIFTAFTFAIQKNMPWILCAWIAGFLLFSMRLTGGLWYTYKLRSTALLLENGWTDYIRTEANKLGIDRLIRLAESTAISTPMVIGYFKPVIMVPMGMLTGLTTEQLETIFLHELAHIKRHDFIISLVQSLVESVLFFNPFVWRLSAIIRREREYCCDDVVVRHHGGSRAYAFALTQLAESRLATHAFALSLAEDRNQLLNRIRRIMEKSVKNSSVKNRIVIPVLLLTGGLICISWLGTNFENGSKVDPPLAEQDTVPHKKENTARYSRKSIITIDENGQPHEEVVEEFEGDEALRPLLAIPDISAMPPSDVMPPADSLPPRAIPPMPDPLLQSPFGFENDDQWKDLLGEADRQFQEAMKQFYSFPDQDPSKFMEELQERLGSEDWRDWSTPFHFNLPPEAFEDFNGVGDSTAWSQWKKGIERLREFNMEHFKDLNRSFEQYHRGPGRYEDVLRDELIKDGYLSGGERIESMEWSDDTFKVNGKNIREADRKKYQELQDRYFGDQAERSIVE